MSDNLAQEIQNLKQSNDEYRNQIVDFQIMEARLKEEIKNLQEEKNQHKNNFYTKEQYANQLEKQMEEVKLQFQSFKNANENTAELTQQIASYEEKIQQNKSEKKKYVDDFNLLKKLCEESYDGDQILKKFKQIQSEKDGDSQKKKQAEQNIYQIQDDMQGYDLQIVFSSVKKLLKDGAEIKLKYDKNSPQYTNQLSKNVHLVAFLGLKNAGKSYWHSKLSKQIIKQGNLHATQGLNINFSEKQWFLDSPGLGETLQNFTQVYEDTLKFEKISQEVNNIAEKEDTTEEDQKIYNDLLQRKQDLKLKIDNEKKNILSQQNELYKEKLAIENFIQSFILTNADVIIYVCDILTLEEQRYITQISQQVERNGRNQKLVVCHNFKTIDTISDFEKCIEKDIYKNFAIELSEKINLSQCSYKNFSISNTATTHLVFGQEGTEIEKKYNQKSIDFMYNMLETLAKQGKTQNLFTSFENYCTKHIKDYIIWNKLKLEGQEQKENGQNQISEPTFSIDYEKNRILSKEHVCLDRKSILCKDILMNYLGEKINDFESAEKACFYEVYKKDLGKGKTLKTFIISAPAFPLIEKLSSKVIIDKLKNLRILQITIKYKKGQEAELIKKCLQEQSEEDQSFQNHQKLKFQNFKFEIPICDVVESCQKDGDYQSQVVQRIDDFGVFQINIEHQTDSASSSDSDSDQ